MQEQRDIGVDCAHEVFRCRTDGRRCRTEDSRQGLAAQRGQSGDIEREVDDGEAESFRRAACRRHGAGREQQQRRFDVVEVEGEFIGRIGAIERRERGTRPGRPKKRRDDFGAVRKCGGNLVAGPNAPCRERRADPIRGGPQLGEREAWSAGHGQRRGVHRAGVKQFVECHRGAASTPATQSPSG